MDLPSTDRIFPLKPGGEVCHVYEDHPYFNRVVLRFKRKVKLQPMPPPPATKRTFLALGLNAPARNAMAAIQEGWRREGWPLALPHPEDAHLTLVFLGATTPPQVEQVIPAMEAVGARHGPFSMPVGGGGFFGPQRTPRVVWVGIPATPALSVLQQDLAGVVAGLGIPLEDRAFHPHLTLARVRDRLPPGALTSMMASINNTHFVEVPVDRVLFMNSQLNGSGPRYTIMHETLLKG